MKIGNIRIGPNTSQSDAPSLDKTGNEALRSDLKALPGRISNFAKMAPRQALSALKHNIYKHEGNKETQGSVLDGAANLLGKGVDLIDKGKAMSSKAKNAIKNEIFKHEGSEETQGSVLDGAANLIGKGANLIDKGKAMSSKAKNAIKKEIFKYEGNQQTQGSFKHEGHKPTQGTLLDGAADLIDKTVAGGAKLRQKMSDAGQTVRQSLNKIGHGPTQE